jgi:hypothetical protein
MKRSLTAFLTAISIIVFAVFAYAGGAPVTLTHEITGYSKDVNTVTLEYAVHVLNQQDGVIGPLSLTLVVQPPLVMAKKVITVDSLRPNEAIDIKVKVESALLGDQKFFTRLPLLWAGKYTDSDGKLVEFPIKSRAGGGK